ncbi:MAG: acyl-[acyl-carrier-protein]--UDP-N-acetylglucosamine O-acyltransferase [Bdellovibrionia bacterium]
MFKIHPTANVHSTVVIEGNVEIGEGTRVGPFCYLKGDLIIGKNNNICANVIIGEGPEHRVKPDGVGKIIIGDNNVIRELTVIQRGTGDAETRIGSNCYLMDHCHIAHDNIISDTVTIAPNTVLAGHVRIHEGATLGIGVAVHQFSTIGAYSMIGMGSIVTKDIFPFIVVSGMPARFQRYNTHHFNKFGLVDGDLYIEHSKLQSRQSNVVKFFETFYADSRRGKLITIHDDVSAT